MPKMPRMPPEVQKHAATLLNHQEMSFRWRAAESLGKTMHQAAVLPLAKALRKDKDMAVRIVAADALGQIGSPKAIPHLANALKDEYLGVRNEAVWALGNIYNAIKDKPAGGKPARALKLVSPHLQKNESATVVLGAYRLALAGKFRPETVRLTIKQLRALSGRVK